MSDAWFAIFPTIVLLIWVGISLVLLLWPSHFLRHFKNPWQPDTPINRVHMRAVGVFFSLFVLQPISSSIKTNEGFHKNILMALWVSPIVLPIFLWILWRYSSLQQVNRRYLAGEPEEGQWELRMSVAFCSLLFVIVVTAFFLGMNGIYPK
jgi:hypothetical protein